MYEVGHCWTSTKADSILTTGCPKVNPAIPAYPGWDYYSRSSWKVWRLLEGIIINNSFAQNFIWQFLVQINGNEELNKF